MKISKKNVCPSILTSCILSLSLENPSRFSIDGDGWITKCFHLTFKYFPAFLKKTFRKCLTFLWKPWRKINFGELQLWERIFGAKIQNEWRTNFYFTAIFFVIAVLQVTIFILFVRWREIFEFSRQNPTTAIAVLDREKNIFNFQSCCT